MEADKHRWHNHLGACHEITVPFQSGARSLACRVEKTRLDNFFLQTITAST